MARRPRNKRMKRSHLKRWSSDRVYAPQGINKEFMSDLAYHDRAKPTELPSDKFMEMVFGRDYVHNQVNEPRSEALRSKAVLEFKNRLEEIASITFMNHRIDLKHTRFEHTCMFYGMKGSNCVLVQVLHGVILKRSVLYDSREKAISRFKDGRVIWVETRNIDPSPATV